MDAIDQLLFAADSNTAEHASRHLAEQGFNDVQPRAMLGRKDKLKTLWVKFQPGLSFFLKYVLNDCQAADESGAVMDRPRRVSPVA